MASPVWVSKNFISSMSTAKVSLSPGLTGVLALAEGAVDKDEAAAVRSGEGVARVAAKIPVKPGDKLTFAVDIDEMKFFDVQTGLAIRG